MKIQVKYEIDDEPFNFLGEISLQYNSEIIIDTCTDIEDWLSVFVDAIRLLKSKNYCEIELVHEPDLLIFQKVDNLLTISYAKQIIHDIPIGEFFSAVYKESGKFISDIENRFGISAIRDFDLLANIYEYVNGNDK